MILKHILVITSVLEVNEDALSGIKSIYYYNNIIKERRTIRSMQRKKLPSHEISNTLTQRASSFTSGKTRQASMTVEAALAVPIFFLAVVSLLYLLEAMAVQSAVRAGAQYAGKELAKTAYLIPMAMPGKLEDDVVSAIGADRLDRSIVEGGSGGIHCTESQMSPSTGILNLVVSYEIRVPLPMFRIPTIKQKTEMRIKGWTGYVKSGFGKNREDTVYVTETGMVYHKDYQCRHLKLSIKLTGRGQIDQLRNSSGGKYYPCERCEKAGGTGGVYVTDTGDRYHMSLMCSGLKRTIYAVPLSEVIGKGACSSCGK